MTNKVTLPREVAEAIRGLIKDHGEGAQYDLAQIHSLIEDKRYFFVIDRYARNNPKEYFAALVNGYTVEQTPEEKVREYYLGLKSAEDSQEIAGHSGSQFRQGWQSVEKTLDLLGIKIEGVNAE